ncbi:hypothetical protein ACQP2P_44220 [Dactylosporangium sp. CA-139114]|uniref:hypothetical protein n=1 Tax=Dactylosporangium sp. CA-139114 TaxID=3239931 RepID=UPI003D9A0940
MPIAGLTELARALLGDRRGDRDVIPEHVSDRVNALAKQWAAHGFTAETVRPWKDLDPAAAARLHAHGASPSALQQHTVATRTRNAVAVFFAEVADAGAAGSKIRNPSRPRSAIRAKSFGLADNRAVVISASNCRCPNPRVGDSAGTVGRRA